MPVDKIIVSLVQYDHRNLTLALNRPRDDSTSGKNCKIILPPQAMIQRFREVLELINLLHKWWRSNFFVLLWFFINTYKIHYFWQFFRFLDIIREIHPVLPGLSQIQFDDPDRRNRRAQVEEDARTKPAEYTISRTFISCEFFVFSTMKNKAESWTVQHPPWPTFLCIYNRFTVWKLSVVESWNITCLIFLWHSDTICGSHFWHHPSVCVYFVLY